MYDSLDDFICSLTSEEDCPDYIDTYWYDEDDYYANFNMIGWDE